MRWWAAGSLAAGVLVGPGVPAQPSGQLDAAAWGDDHVGRPLPGYVTGGECLFCHRDDVGPSWQSDPHRQTVRLARPDDPPVAAVEAFLAAAGVTSDVQAVLGGSEELLRYLRPNGRYGQYALLSVAWEPEQAGDGEPTAGRLVRTDDPRWDDDKYALRCAGCHSTAVDAELRAFSAPSLDCYVCHGDVDATHPEDGSRVILSPHRADAAEVVTSICAQCHIRSGRSRSSGLPYPNQFVPGDNLFRDFAADFSDQALARLDPPDRHVLENVRRVVLRGDDERTCLSCHRLHEPSAREHRGLRTDDSCMTCHDRQGPRWLTKDYQDRSELCEY